MADADHHPPEKYGVPLRYDPEFTGPRKRRSCTDIICLFLFTGFVVGWVFIGLYAFKEGDPEKILKPSDSNGLRCGLDSEVLYKPYLFFFDISKCADPTVIINGCNTPQVCIEKCPDHEWSADPYLDGIKSFDINDIRNNLICIDDSSKNNVRDKSSLSNAINNNLCARWYTHSYPLHRRCLPFQSNNFTDISWNKVRQGISEVVMSIRESLQSYSHGSKVAEIRQEICTFCMPLKNVREHGRFKVAGLSNVAALNRCLPLHIPDSHVLKNMKITDALQLVTNVTNHIQSLAYSQEVGAEIFDDLTKTWRIILMCFGVAIIVSLIYIFLLRYMAGILTWLSIIAVLALAITGTIFSYERYQYLKKYGPPPVKNKMIVGTLEEWSYSPTLWIVVGVGLIIIAFIFFVVVVSLRKRISIAITLIKEGSKAVSSIMTSLFFPIIPWIFECCIAAWVLIVLCFLMSIGTDVFIAQGMESFSCACKGEYENLKSGDTCDPVLFDNLCKDSNTGKNCTLAGCHFFKQEKQDIVTYFEVFNVFGFFWGIWFISGLSQMMLAGAFASWYWTFNKRDVPFFAVTASVGRTIRYHLGTVAFGSLIIAICSFIRACLEYLQRKLKKFDNDFVKAIFCCCKCFFWCLERFLKFVNRNAYIMCAIHGKNFCSSAGHAFNLLMRNAIRVVVLDKVTDFLFFIGKLVITGCMVAGSYYLFIRNTKLELHYNGATPLVVIAIGSYIIASIFFGVYQMAVDTLFLCFLEDCERNDGSAERPYFMSKNLMRILGKKNKKTD